MDYKDNLKEDEKERLEEFCDHTGIKLDDLSLLKVALTHRSYINEKGNNYSEHNERLEFLGDAVLELLVSKYLFDQYPDKPEGELTSFRAATVRTESLASEAQRLGYGQFLYMSKGEARTGGRTRPYILANTFESVVGALYLDQGIKVVKKFLEKELFYKIDEIVVKRLDIDSKSKLQELAQEILRDTPVYEIVDSTGPDHLKIFKSQVKIKGEVFGTGKGSSKQQSEQNAATNALENWKELLAEHFYID